MSTLYPAEFVLAQSVTGILGVVIIFILSIHAIYKLQREDVGGKFSRFLYILFFLSSWIACVGFAFFRSNLILPMGETISCKIGFYLSTQGVFLSKTFLFIIFIYRIDLAFHSSALKYPRWMLATTVTIYALVIITLDTFYVMLCYPLIHLEPFNLRGRDIGNCTTATSDETATEDDSSIRLYLLGLMFVGDVMFSIFVCGLFVYKLNKVIKMMQDDSGSHNAKDLKLPHLVRKQTILVFVACITSASSLGGGALYPGYSLLISTDVTTNFICVWLMFAFSDRYWEFIVKRVCCCCYCCVYKEEFLFQMQSISKKYSMRRDTHRQQPNGTISSPIHSTIESKNSSNDSRSKNNKQPYTAPKPQSVIEEHEHDDKHIDIINFNNAKDIKTVNIQEKNAKKKDEMVMDMIVNDSNNNNNKISTETNTEIDDPEIDDDTEIIQSVTKSTSDTENKVMDPQTYMPHTSSDNYVKTTENSISNDLKQTRNIESSHL